MNLSKLLEEPKKLSLILLNFVKLILTITISDSLFQISNEINVDSLQSLINEIKLTELLTSIIIIVVVWFVIWTFLSSLYIYVFSIQPLFKKKKTKRRLVYLILKELGVYKESKNGKKLPTKKTVLFEAIIENESSSFNNINAVEYFYLFTVIFVFYLFNTSLLFGYALPILIIIGVLILLGVIMIYNFQLLFSFIQENSFEFLDFVFKLKYSRMIKDVLEEGYRLKINENDNYKINILENDYEFLEFATESQPLGLYYLEEILSSLNENTIIITNITPSEKLIELIKNKNLAGIITANNEKEISSNLSLFLIEMREKIKTIK